MIVYIQDTVAVYAHAERNGGSTAAFSLEKCGNTFAKEHNETVFSDTSARTGERSGYPRHAMGTRARRGDSLCHNRPALMCDAHFDAGLSAAGVAFVLDH